MKQENANFDLKELTEKIEKIDELCKKDFFSNPVRDIQMKMREELLEFSNIFNRNLRDLDSLIAQLETNTPTNPAQQKEDEETVPKKNLDKKEYQIDILKRAFSEYEEKTNSQLDKLSTENTKLKYRIGILLNTIENLEKK